MVTSRLNHRCIGQTLGLIALGVLSLCGVSLFNKETFLPILFVWLGFTLLFSAFYLASIKRIIVVADGLETQNLNFEEIKGTIAVKDKSGFFVRENAEVVSEYDKVRLYGITGFGLFFVLIGVAVALSDVIDGRPLRLGSIIIGISAILLFGSLLFIYLFSHKEIKVWRGQVEVKRLLWPFKVRYYDVSDFDGFYYVLEKSNGQLGSRDENSIWLVKNHRLAVSVSEPMYRNYEELKTAFQPVPCLGRLEFIDFQSLKYHLGKKINWR